MKSRLREWLGPIPDTEAESAPVGLSQYVWTLPQLLAIELPEPEYLVEPFLPTASLSEVFAERGLGKTWFILHLAICLALGIDFFCWVVPKPRNVLVIDGEMPLGSLQYRLRALAGPTPIPNLRVVSVAEMWRHNDSLTINEPADQQRIEELLEQLTIAGGRPDLVILDNLSSLVAGIDENSNSELTPFLRWLIKLRAQGVAVLFVHHAGKNGEQRGASRREDLLDTAIQLVKSTGLFSGHTDGARFDIHFTKLRGERPKPDRLCVALTQGDSEHLEWKIEEGKEIAAYLHVVREIQLEKPLTQIALAASMKISKQAVNAQIKTAREKGLLKEGTLELTPKGIDEMKKLFAWQDEMMDKM